MLLGFVKLFFLFRLSTVVNCDKILVLDGGQVVESGSHTELLANPASKYAGQHTYSFTCGFCLFLFSTHKNGFFKTPTSFVSNCPYKFRLVHLCVQGFRRTSRQSRWTSLDIDDTAKCTIENTVLLLSKIVRKELALCVTPSLFTAQIRYTLH